MSQDPLLSSEPGVNGPLPMVWVGVNFWSSVGGPRMWARYDGDTVREELAVLAELGLNTTRSFCYWPDFMPAPETLDEEVMERFGEFLDLHTEVGLVTVPTFVVGHMSGQNWDPAWRAGRDLYRDVWMVSQQAWFVAEVARRTAQHPAITGWLLTNEMPNYAPDGDHESVTAWARILVQALRSAGATQPVSTGDGANGIEVSGQDNGFSLRRLAPMVDFIGPHTYPSGTDPVRQHLTAAFACELCASFGKPVVLEEFGLSSDMVSGPHAADYYRQVLHSSLLAGAKGWLAWNNCDFDSLAAQDPYRHHPFEMHFGITDHSRRPKPQGYELSRFARLASRLAATGWERVGGEVAIVVPEHFEHTEPSWSPVFRGDVRNNLFQSYIAAREADLPVALVREVDLVADVAASANNEEAMNSSPGLAARLYLLPCAKLMTAPGVQAVLGRAREGAVVYASYFAGSGRDQVGPWMPWLGPIFGVRHDLRYGLGDPIEDDVVTLEIVRDFGGLEDGTRLSFTVGGQGFARSHLPIEPAGAEVLAVDDMDRPAILCNRAGDGWMVLCTYPLEHMAASVPDVNPEATWQLYSGLADAAGVSRPVRVADPRVTVGAIDLGAGSGPRRRLYLALNLSDEVVAVPVIAPGLAVRLSPTPGGLEPPPGERPGLAGLDSTVPLLLPEGSAGGEGPGIDVDADDEGDEPQEADELQDVGGVTGPFSAPEDEDAVESLEGELSAEVDEPEGSPAAAVVTDEVGHELLELTPYEVVLLEVEPLVPSPGQDASESAVTATSETDDDLGDDRPSPGATGVLLS